MTVLAIFKYDVKAGRMGDFMARLAEAASPQCNSPVMPRAVRLVRRTVPELDMGPVILMIEYPDMAADGARTAFENANAAWKALFAAQIDSPRDVAAGRTADQLRAARVND